MVIGWKVSFNVTANIYYPWIEEAVKFVRSSRNLTTVSSISSSPVTM